MLAAGADPRYASPGVGAFLVMFFLAVATWLLIRSMVGHLRKVRYTAEAAERAAAAPPTAAEKTVADTAVAATAAVAAKPVASAAPRSVAPRGAAPKGAKKRRPR